MRLNRGTFALIALLLVIIAVVVVINNQQANAPAATATPQTAAGPLLPGLAGENVVRYEVRDNTTGSFIALTKDSGGAWHIDSTNAIAGRNPDQTIINTTVGQIATINYSNTFQDDQLTTFGLDHPAYSVLVTTNDNQFYTIYIGAKSPTSARYYTVVEQVAVPESATSEATAEATAEATTASSPKRVFQAATEEATSEATAEATSEATAEVTLEPTPDALQNPQVTLEGQQTIYLIPQTVIDTLKNWLNTPPYAPLPTGVPTNEAVTPEVATENTEEAVGVQGTVQPTPLLQEGADPDLIPEGTPFATQLPSEEATAAP